MSNRFAHQLRTGVVPEIIQFESGLRLVIHPLPHLNLASINVRVDAGSRCESPSQAGLAHFVEHLLFQGSQRWPSAYALNREVEILGAEMWGASHTEYCSYWLNAPYVYLPQALPVFLDTLTHPLFPADSIARERGVILDEIAEMAENGSVQAQFLLDEALWREHPLGRRPIGSAETLAALTLEDVRRFFNQHYTPERLVIAVVGNVDRAALIEACGAAWPGLPTNTETPNITPPAVPAANHRRVEHGGNVVHLTMGLAGPPLNHADAGCLLVLRTLLTEGMSSVLFTQLRSESGLCYSISSYLDELRHATVFAIAVTMQPANLEEVVQRICATLGRIANGGTIATELELARRQAIGQLMMQSDQAYHHARTDSLSLFLCGELVTTTDTIAQVEAVDISRFQQFVGALLQPANLHLSLVGSVSAEIWQACQASAAAW